MTGKPKRVREAVMVYLDARDRELLERVAKKTGLARTELLRRGLWQVASQELGEEQPGSAFRYLIDTASDADLPPDLSSRHEHYLYGGGYEAWFAKRKSAKKPAANLAAKPATKSAKPVKKRARLR